MNIIYSHLLKNIIGFDIGNGLTTPILRNNIIPCSNTIQFIMSDINISHSIKIYKRVFKALNTTFIMFS